MGVYIKNMEIPKRCIDCPCYYPEYYECNIVHNCNPISHNSPIPQYCPLIEVPKHGRLIDADALNELIDSGDDIDFSEVPETKYALMQMVREQETIIESEGEDGR